MRSMRIALVAATSRSNGEATPRCGRSGAFRTDRQLPQNSALCASRLSLGIALLAIGLLFHPQAMAGVTASISGTVKDPSGAQVVGATVTATNTDTGISQSQPTNAQGFYSFQSLSLGHYDVQVQQSGFKAFRQTGLVLDVNAALVVDVALQIGQVQEVVEVTSGALHVETASSQLGEVIGGEQMTSVPLATRSYTDLLALQPGVAPTPSGLTGSGAGAVNSNFISAGFAVPQVSGDLNAGNLSVNGMREGNNGFLLNGATVQEFGYGGTSVIPNLDSIAEFRILTNNFDAEYGNYSGGQINVITKSGANRLHGNVFEFLRNTDFDAANYFDQGKRGAYHQNQFGGTLGGPIVHDKIFFFGDYQGNRVVQGVSSGQVPVPTVAERNGNFSDPSLESQMSGKTVKGAAWAAQLSNQLGYTVNQNESYFSPGCVTTASCVFPNGQIPVSGFSPIASNLLKYIPAPTSGSSFSTSAFPLTLKNNKLSGRVDGNSHFGLLSAYYYLDRYTLDSPYPTATVPGFDAAGKGGTNLVNLGDTRTFGTNAVNEVRFEFVRNNISLNQPKGGTGVSLSSLGFTTGTNTLGIVPVDPTIEGVPEIDFNSFVIGVPSRPNRLIENTFQGLDNFSKVVGTHTLKFGGTYHYTQLVEQLSNVVNGNFQFFGGETGIDFLDFLVGAPSFYLQGQAEPSNGRSRYFGLYGQDSWRVRSNLTVNYGLRWDVSSPWSEQHNQIQTIVPGLQSVVFPGSPTGWVFPGDPGIPSTLAPTRYNNFAPRLGVAYSPDTKTSIRAGYGVFFTSLEGATNFNEIGDAPFGFFYASPVPPSFATPFADRGTGTSEQQRFPVVFPPLNVSVKNPDNNVNWTLFTPIASSPGFFFKSRLPYAEDYELSIQRQFTANTLMTVSYVGTQGHRLLSTLESNPGNPTLCLATAGCGPGLENQFQTRLPIFGPNFGSNGYFITIGQSSYNSFQLNLRHTSSRLTTLVGYTYSKSIDNSSGYGEQVNPFNPKLSMGLSAFDATHNFVVSYNYRLPFDKLGGPKRLTVGWALSGITRFATGIPVIIYENDDNSLLGTQFTGPITLGIDTPNLVGAVHTADPRIGPYFNPSAFAPETIGQLGTARRRFFHGPGINNWDMALLKDTPLTEKIHLEFRAEFFNLFNHAQFGAVNGNFSAGTGFGLATSAAPPRIGQLSLKLNF
jgi:outer membrane receptor protein involved in Fe transport